MLVTVHRPVQPNTRPDNQRRGVRALASAPHLEPLGVYYILALSMGKETDIESEGARPTVPPSRVRAVTMHTCSAGPARLRPPSQLTTAPIGFSAPPLPTSYTSRGAYIGFCQKV